MENTNRFKKARLAAGYTQQDVANAMGCKQNTVSMWEQGKSYPRGLALIRLARLYNSTVSQLLGEEAQKDD